MPLIYLTSTAAPSYTHEPFEVRLQGGEVMYTLTVSTTNRTFVAQEHVSALTTALGVLDANITLRTAAE